MKSKKIIMIVLLIAFCVIIGVVMVGINSKAASQNGETAKNEDIVEITDNYFIQQTNDVYINLDDYIGKTIKMEGLIYSYNDASSGNVCYAVVRNGPGCCGNDGIVGLDIRYDGDYPNANTWVEVIGVMGTDTVQGRKIPAIQVVSMTETERGATAVSN